MTSEPISSTAVGELAELTPGARHQEAGCLRSNPACDAIDLFGRAKCSATGSAAAGENNAGELAELEREVRAIHVTRCRR